MTKSRMKFGALLAVMLIVSMAFVPAVSAKAENEKNQFDTSNFQSLSYSDIQNLSDKEIESLMSKDQKKLFQDLAKQEYSVTEVGDDKIITTPAIDADGKVIKQKVMMTLMSKTDNTELYFVERGAETELVTIQRNGTDVRITGYDYDKTKSKAEYDVAVLRDHGNKKYDVWTENGYLRVWFSPIIAAGGATAVTTTLIYAIGLVLAYAGIAISSGGLIVIVTFVVLAAYLFYGNPDASLDIWIDLNDLITYADKLTNWWPYDYGIIDAYAGMSRNHYIPVPYGPV